jgi:hypothetical protein
MTKASADADKVGATERRAHKESGMLAWRWLTSGSRYVSHGQQSPRSWQFSNGRVSIGVE